MMKTVNSHDINKKNTTRRVFTLIFLTWLGVVGVDFFLNAGVFSWVYLKDSSFLLSPSEAFELIPLGYVGLLCNIVMFFWVMVNQRISGSLNGLFFGLIIGGLIQLAGLFGLKSISTAENVILFVMFISGLIQFAVSGLILGHGFAVECLNQLTLKIITIVVFLSLVTILLQSLGFVVFQPHGLLT